MEVKWIKLATNIFDNRKIKQIEVLPDGYAIIVMWIKLLCLAGTINADGYVYFTEEIPYTEQMLSAQFGIPLNTVQMAMKVFQQFGMIDVESDIMRIANWEKYQNIEGMDKIREQNRIRKQNQRLREKEQKMISNVTSHVTVTQSHATDIDIDLDIEKEKKSNSKFRKPTLQEVTSYCMERGNNIDPQRFIDYYDSNGWKVGNNHMKDWQATVRNWERKAGFTYKKEEPVKEDADELKRQQEELLKMFKGR